MLKNLDHLNHDEFLAKSRELNTEWNKKIADVRKSVNKIKDEMILEGLYK